MTVLNAVAVCVKMPVVKQGDGLGSQGSSLPSLLQMTSPVKMLMMLISMLTSPPEEVTVCVIVVNWSTVGEIVPACGGPVIIAGLATEVAVWTPVPRLDELLGDTTCGVAVGFGGFSTKGTVSVVVLKVVGFEELLERVTVAVLWLAGCSTTVTVSAVEFDALLAEVAVAELCLAGLFVRVTVAVLGLTGFSTNVTVSMVEFDALLSEAVAAEAVAEVLEVAWLSTEVIVSTVEFAEIAFEGLFASVTTVVLGLAGVSKNVTVSAVGPGGFCTTVTVLILGFDSSV